jgi:hypothetical protein
VGAGVGAGGLTVIGACSTGGVTFSGEAGLGAGVGVARAQAVNSIASASARSGAVVRYRIMVSRKKTGDG